MSKLSPFAPDADDALGAVLSSLDVVATHASIANFSAPWALDCHAFAPAFIIAVLEGTFLFASEGLGTRTVGPGDLLLLTRPLPIIIRSSPDAPVTKLDDFWFNKGLPRWADGHRLKGVARTWLGGGGVVTRFVSIVVQVSQGWGQRLMPILPPVIHIAGDQAGVGKWLEPLVSTLMADGGEPQPGYVAIALKAAELIFISLLRAHLLQGTSPGWLRCLSDDQLSRAVLAIHRAPGRRWTVSCMAELAGLSRSVFARRFTETAGESPHQFLMRERMRLAASWIGEGHLSAKEISQLLGFSTPSAFSQAFRHHFMITPSAYRGQSQRRAA